MLKDSHAFSGFSTNDIAAARAFYADTLGLEVSENMGMLDLKFAGGGHGIVYPKPNQPYAPGVQTAQSIATSIGDPVAVTVAFERYEGLEQDERGIARDPQGPAIAWFKDPAGNILSVLQG